VTLQRQQQQEMQKLQHLQHQPQQQHYENAMDEKLFFYQNSFAKFRPNSSDEVDSFLVNWQRHIHDASVKGMENVPAYYWPLIPSLGKDGGMGMFPSSSSRSLLGENSGSDLISQIRSESRFIPTTAESSNAGFLSAFQQSMSNGQQQQYQQQQQENNELSSLSTSIQTSGEANLRSLAAKLDSSKHAMENSLLSESLLMFVSEGEHQQQPQETQQAQQQQQQQQPHPPLTGLKSFTRPGSGRQTTESRIESQADEYENESFDG